MGTTWSRWRNYAETGYHSMQEGIERNAEIFKPGKPQTDGEPRTGAVVLSWQQPHSLYTSHRYQIRYKTLDGDMWQFCDDQPKDESIDVSGLLSKTKYTFQIRMVNTDIEGPYSQPSDDIETPETAAKRYLELTHEIKDTNENPSFRCVPLKDVTSNDDKSNGVRRFELGSLGSVPELEKTIILVGCKGSGKKTFIDGLINYWLAVHWKDPHRFTITAADTHTHMDEWTNCYTINPLPGCRHTFKLTIIDTPGFDDNDDRLCKNILKQLTYLFTAHADKLEFIDAVCFIVRSPDTKLTVAQSSTFRSVFSSIGLDIEENVCLVTTFADCKEPQILKSFDQDGIAHGGHFPFNNAALFVPNDGTDVHPLAPMFWNIGQTCFKTFFQHLVCLPRKTAMPKIPDRAVLEDDIEALQPLVASGLDEIVELKNEKQIIESNKRAIEEDKTFTYEITERRQKRTDLPPGQNVTNCLNCNVTCHLSCAIPRNEDKHGCSAMDNTTGHCTVCIDKCHWKAHANTPYIYEYEEVVVTKTYTEKVDKYRKAPNEDVTVATVIDRMDNHVTDLEMRIRGKMDEIRSKINLLRRASHREESMSVDEQIELLIKSEEEKHRIGYESRIVVLRDLRRL